MSEYDYSGLYNQNPQNTPPTGGQNPPQNNGESSGYPNVGSSGMNTANTARTDFTSSEQPSSQSQNTGYGSSYGSNSTGSTGYGSYDNGTAGPGGPNGPVNGYGAQPEPPQPPRRKKGGKTGLRVLAGVGMVLLGFGGGLLGTVAATRMGLNGSQVVVQQVQRDENADASQGSAGGSNLSMTEIAAKVQPSVVAITTEQMVSTNSWFGSYVQSGAGSGVIISEDGYILTCAHVVNGASNITVQLSDDTEYTASIVGLDTSTDVAVLKIDATGLSAATLGDSDTLAVGELAVAVGNPLGTLSGTVTNGIISAVNRSVEVESNEMSLIQTDAAISPGNSGGGLFNGQGELIGIVNAKSGSTTDTGEATNAEGLGFAIPINTAMDIAQDLIENGYVKRPALGVTVITVTQDNAMQFGVSNYGVYIYQITPGSGADNAGLQVGDRIIAIDDNSVSDSSDLTGYLQQKAVGDTVNLQIERDGKMATYQVVLGEGTSGAASTTENAAG